VRDCFTYVLSTDAFVKGLHAVPVAAATADAAGLVITAPCTVPWSLACWVLLGKQWFMVLACNALLGVSEQNFLLPDILQGL
jgi:hypothetical protein